MNRVIKFRGKRKDTGEWITGSLVVEYEGSVFISYWVNTLTEPENNYWEPVHEYHEVIPESAGLILELKDKNSKTISEGDILLRTQYLGGNWVDRTFERFVVSYNALIAGFEYKPIDGIEYKQYTIRPFGGDEIEIIGNIHDNPELLTPSQKGDVLNTMIDPKQQEEATQQATQESAVAESAAQDSAMEVTQDSEEGTTEG